MDRENSAFLSVREKFLRSIYGISMLENKFYLVPSRPGFSAELRQNILYDNAKVYPSLMLITPRDSSTEWAREDFKVVKNTQRRLKQAYTEIADELIAQRTPDVLRLPRRLLIDVSTDPDFICEIFEQPQGQHIIDLEAFRTRSFSDPDMKSKIEQFVKLHDSFKKISYCMKGDIVELKKSIAETSAEQYFIERFQKWERLSRTISGKHSSHPSIEQMKLRLISFILETPFNKIKMGLSRSLFGNTDIIVTSEGQYYLMNGQFEIKPKCFFPAALAWNHILYACVYQSPRQIWDNVLLILEAFGIEKYSIKYLWFCANLFERMYAAIEVDFGLRRSPFTDYDEETTFRAIECLTSLIKGYAYPQAIMSASVCPVTF